MRIIHWHIDIHIFQAFFFVVGHMVNNEKSQMCTGCCKFTLGSSWFLYHEYNPITALFTLKERKTFSSLDIWVLSGCLPLGYIVLSTDPVTFWAVAHFHTLAIRVFFLIEIFKQINGWSWRRVLRKLNIWHFHSRLKKILESQVNGRTFLIFSFWECFFLTTIKDEWNQRPVLGTNEPVSPY